MLSHYYGHPVTAVDMLHQIQDQHNVPSAMLNIGPNIYLVHSWMLAQVVGDVIVINSLAQWQGALGIKDQPMRLRAMLNPILNRL